MSDDVGRDRFGMVVIFLEGMQVSGDVGSGEFKSEEDWASAGIGHGSPIVVLEHVQVQ